MSKQRLRIGLIGAGNILKRHATAYRALPQLATLSAVSDIDKRRAESARDRFGFKTAHTDYREMLGRDDVDVVDICTPASLHTSMVIDAIEAGKHVLCEKPMATTLGEADRIIAAADAHPKQTVGFVFQLRSEATHRRLRLMIEGGHMGRPLTGSVTVRIRKTPAYYKAAPGRGSWKMDGGGVLINQAIHQLDALISFLGDPVEVSAVADTFVQPTEGEDTLAGWVKFDSGAFVTIGCTVCAQSKHFQIDVQGERAAMSLSGNPDANSFSWSIKATGGAARKTLQSTSQKLSPNPPDPGGLAMGVSKLMCKIKRKEWVPPVHWGHGPFLREFLTAINKGEPGPVPPREGRRSLELVTALYESARIRENVTLPLRNDCPIYEGVAFEKVAVS